MNRHRLQGWCIAFIILGTSLGGTMSAHAWQQNPDSERFVILRVDKDNKGDFWRASFIDMQTESKEVRGSVGDVSLLVKIKQFTTVSVTVESSAEVSEQALVETVAALHKAGIGNIHMLGPYFADAGRVYYYGSTLTGVTAPKLGVDRQALQKIAAALGVREKVPSMSMEEKFLGYFVLLDETGTIIKIKQIPPPPPQFPELETALAEAKVLAPGKRGELPVRSVVFVMVDLK
jgi:hypothetical protein